MLGALLLSTEMAARAIRIGAFVLSAASAHSAAAEFQVCNQTFDVINVAIGQAEAAGGFKTEGWWTVGTNQCARVVREELKNRFIYIHATDVFGQPVVESPHSMCVDSGRFEIFGASDCWQRGYRDAPFVEVDTKAVERWTLFLSLSADE